ncbi:fatty acid desaturase family protein [Deinococcus yavapaiensis]|uniref:Fatty acid desaturase n=1 Tax=Deinococcus yavapaiensis KR-236 TaxID=694435 RepID=A0A318SI34_9DEIO|nr:fatty acid desaturase [Deinococcus yavapaiensis]PYE53646.1 fatty acid desaturase [Deinococcus yavapaiensis KR-236]
MNELQHLGVYARELKKHLPKEVFDPVPGRLWWLVPHVSIVVGCVLLITLTALPLLVKLLLSVMIGGAFACLGFLGHEVLHGSVVRRAWLRDFIGAVCFWPFGVSTKLWRRWHNVEHHGQTQHPDLDPDAFDTLEAYDGHVGVRFLAKLPPRVRSLLYFVSFTFWFSLHAILVRRAVRHQLSKQDRLTTRWQTLAPYAFWVAFGVLVGPANFVLIYLLPVLIGNFLVIAYIATNHGLNPLTETNDPLENSLSVVNPRWLDALHLNFSHHVEHHVLPSVNPVHAPKIKAALKRLYPDRYKELPWFVALKALWFTPRFYGRDRMSLVGPEGRTYGTLGHGLDARKVQPRDEA